MPEVASELRCKVRVVLAENDRVFSSKALLGLKKTDSFMKEMLRYHPFAFGMSRPLSTVLTIPWLTYRRRLTGLATYQP
ncbi:uncharacterized protein BCR38DRAFT_432309 [Pseudomassariella vexata]|uniref:Uncharacterized protein n=1 Tax=Pseudomassariella vexata TaxID=1141098 RepID=A0A1Y2E152_9PEZI|nr:uncharacterized protein BCR38DRAFT_432309 [Pseudomassariella vexata]ORY65283.1 hypothetical protein BCR38DRAFT_432309 [Pseudomassariella vexata]